MFGGHVKTVALSQNDQICVATATIRVRSATKIFYFELRPINRSNLPIQDGSHQYVVIHHISLTSHYSIVTNGSIPSFFGMANSLIH